MSAPQRKTLKARTPGKSVPKFNLKAKTKTKPTKRAVALTRKRIAEPRGLSAPHRPLSVSAPHTLRRLSPLFSSTAEAGVAVSSTATRHASISGDLLKGIRVKILEPFGSLYVPAASTPVQSAGFYPTLALLASTDGAAPSILAYQGSTALNPVRCPFITRNPTLLVDAYSIGLAYPDGYTLAQLAGGFSQYRVNSLNLHYRPQTSTLYDASFWLAFTEDPAQPRVGVRTRPLSSSSPWPTAATLESCANTISFPGWAAWSAQFPCHTDVKYLEQAGSFSSQSTGVVYGAPDIRTTCFGAITAGCTRGTNVASEEERRVGELYWELDIEFMDPTPLRATPLPPTLLAGNMRDVLKPCLPTSSAPVEETKEEKKSEVSSESLPPIESCHIKLVREEDDDDTVFCPAPPSARGYSPSSIPGSSGYSPVTTSLTVAAKKGIAPKSRV